VSCGTLLLFFKKEITMKKTIVIITAVLAVLLLFTSIWATNNTSEEDKDKSWFSKLPFVKNKTFTQNKTLLFWPKQTLVFDIDYGSSLFFEQSNEPINQVKINGQLLIKNIAENKNPVLAVSFYNPEILILDKNNDIKKMQKIDALEKEFQNHYLIKIDNKGHIEAIQVPASSTGLVQSVLKNMFSMIQFVGSENGHTKWEVQEKDTTGKLMAMYEKLTANKVIKKKMHYVEVSSNKTSESSLKADIINSELEFFLDNLAILKELNAIDHIEITGSAYIASSRARTNLKLKAATSKQKIDGFESITVAYFDDFHTLSIDGPLTKKALEDQLDQAKIGDLNFTSSMELLASLDHDLQADQRKKEKIMLALEAMFRQQPETIEKARDEIFAGNPDSNLITSALGYAGTEEAQDTLIGFFLNADKTGESGNYFLQALAFGDHPSERNISLHESLFYHDKYANQARYGLGSIIHKMLYSGQTQSAQTTLGPLLSDLKNCSTDAACIVVLGALGNAGAPDTLEEIIPFFDHSNPDLRKAAVDAVRRIPGNEAEALIIEKLLSDTDATVRIDALKILGSRTPYSVNGLNAVSAAATKDQSPQVRYRSITILAKFSSIDKKTVVSLLNWISQNDSDEKIRKLATDVLKYA
jgi:HEAT repeat protein